MTPDELRRSAEKLYGKRWIPPFCKEIGKDDATVYRWLENKTVRGIPKYVERFFVVKEREKKLERLARSMTAKLTKGL